MNSLIKSATFSSICKSSLTYFLQKSSAFGTCQFQEGKISTEAKIQPPPALSLLDIFKKYQGLLALNTKVPIRDNYALSLAYTPGVGKSCKEIEKNENLALMYTNKQNSILVMTDSTGFSDYVPENWHNNIPIPYMESLCYYYKAVANIDAYPIILDYKRIKNEDDLLELIVKLAPGYQGYEMYKISADRLRKLEQKFKALKEKPKVVLFTQLQRDYLEYKMANMNLLKDIQTSQIIAGIIRAALDTCSYGIVSRELIDYVLTGLKTALPDCRHKHFRACNYAAQYIIKHGLHQDKNITHAQVKQKYLDYLIEGPNSWIEPTPAGYYIPQHSIDENSLLMHKKYRGVIELAPKISLKDPVILDKLLDMTQISAIAELIKKNPSIANEITCKRNLSTIITNGTAVLGFGDIGPTAGLPVMEGKSVLFKLLGGVDLVPICVEEKDTQKLIEICRKILPIFCSINLEDIKAPECVDIERTLISEYNFPIFHDDQHGTAIVISGALINACKLTNKKLSDLKIVINGSGAAGMSICEMLLHAGAKNVVVCDTKGIIYEGRKENMNVYKDELAKRTNKSKLRGNLAKALAGADVFVGVSSPKQLTKEMIKTMNKDPWIFAMANPIPEIFPWEAKEAGAYIVSTGRSDFKNQVNNCLAFPGLFRGLIDIEAKKVTMELKMGAAAAIANILKPEEITPDYIIPNALDSRVSIEVAKGVARAGLKQGINQREIYRRNCRRLYEVFHARGKTQKCFQERIKIKTLRIIQQRNNNYFIKQIQISINYNILFVFNTKYLQEKWKQIYINQKKIKLNQKKDFLNENYHLLTNYFLYYQIRFCPIIQHQSL